MYKKSFKYDRTVHVMLQLLQRRSITMIKKPVFFICKSQKNIVHFVTS